MSIFFSKFRPIQTEEAILEGIKRDVNVSLLEAFEYGIPVNMDDFYIDQLKKIWAVLKEKYHTKYKMTTDILDWNDLTDKIECVPGCKGDVFRGNRTFSARFANRTWSLSWIGNDKFQIIFISPFGHVLPGRKFLCATYRIPEMIADTDLWAGKLDELITEETMKIRQKLAQKRIYASTAKSLLNNGLSGLCEYSANYNDDHVKVTMDLHQNRRVILKFQYNEMYEKIPHLVKTVINLNALIDEFGPEVSIGYSEDGISSLFKKQR